jgi:hypothetical protein
MSQAAVVAPKQMQMKIKYKGQTLKFAAVLHPKTGDLDQLEEVKYYEKHRGEEIPVIVEPGAVWATNRDLARRTEHATQYSCFTRGKYDRMRAALHASQNYGLDGRNPGSEIQKLFRDEEGVRLTSLQLLTQGASFVDPQLWLTRSMQPLITEYQWKYDIRKVMARQDMSRGVQLTDSLGRRNVSAARLALGAAIGNLQLRKKAIRFLDAHVTQEAREAAYEIEGIRDSYRRLKYGFNPSLLVDWAYADAGRIPPAKMPGPRNRDWMSLARDERAWPGLQASLEWSLPFFQAMVALPFRRNATHVVDDLTDAITAMRKGRAKNLEESMLRLRAGIRWFFALDHLEMQVVLPLAILLDDLEMLHKACQPKGSRAKFNPYKEMAPSEFAQILEQYYRFVGFVDGFKDGILVHPKQEEILAIVNRIAETLEFDDWLTFHEQVLSITDLL